MSMATAVETVLESSIEETVAIVVGLLVAIEEAQATYGGNLDGCPPPLQVFCSTLEATAAEYMAR